MTVGSSGFGFMMPERTKMPVPRDAVEERAWAVCLDMRQATWTENVAGRTSVQQAFAAPPEDQLRSVRFCFDVLAAMSQDVEADLHYIQHWRPEHLASLLGKWLQKPLAFEDADLCSFLSKCHSRWTHCVPVKAVLRLLQRRLGDVAATGPLRDALVTYREFLRRHPEVHELRELMERTDGLITGLGIEAFRIERVDAWTAALLERLHRDGDRTESWRRLLHHAVGATSVKPSKQWLKEARRLTDELGEPEVVATLTAVVDAIGTKSPVPIRVPRAWVPGGLAEVDPTQVADRHSDELRGLLWCAALVRSPELLGSIADAADRCFKKIPGHGPRAPKIGNAALWTLSQSNDLRAAAHLVRLSTRVKHASSRRQVEKALTTAAERAGLSRDDLEELAVPRCGLTGIGVLEQPLGDHVAELALTSSRSTELRFRAPDGTLLKGAPAALRERFPTELTRLRQVDKELRQLLPAQCDRIERLLRHRRTLPFPEWKERYLLHPVLGYLTRRLIWEFGEARVPAVPHEDSFIGYAGTRVEPGDQDSVSLWHPLRATRDVVQGFRSWLAGAGLVQPFKQAHREIYILTDAERQTNTYSNRFASHVLRQHQLAALCRERGFRYTLQGGWDSHNFPTLDLPQEGYRAEFWVEGAGDVREAAMSEAGVFLYVTTDQVRFYRAGEAEPLPLEHVPPLLFSEVMRDVDLFVGVASVGNDPTWLDRGEQRFTPYWNDYAFGPLGETAETRREVLATLLPKLTIASRCTLDGRFLVVRGDLRTYRIHLGSANIQMAPNDQYLCIVPGRGQDAAPGNVMLPFEGDRVLSLVLSKAFLLASDRKIKDPSILSQIHRA